MKKFSGVIMKNLFMCLTVFSASVSFANGNSGFDGCYMLTNGETPSGMICISGTTEEGIGGSNARLVVMDVATPKSCVKSTSLKMTATRLEFLVGDQPQLILSNPKPGDEGTTTYDVQITDVNGELHSLFAFTLDKKTTAFLNKNIEKSGICN